jgi:hypothetical protein
MYKMNNRYRRVETANLTTNLLFNERQQIENKCFLVWGWLGPPRHVTAA